MAMVTGVRMPAGLRMPATIAVVAAKPGNATVVKQSASVEISSTAATASDMFAIANKFVRDEHIEPFRGYDKGIVSPGGHLNVEKYNNYIFDKAASEMVGTAANAGLTLSKGDILDALKTSNSGIASLKNDETARIANLGQASVLSHINLGDLNFLTDMYIKGKSADLEVSIVKDLAGQMGLSNKYKNEGISVAVYDPERELKGLPYTDTAVQVSADSVDEFDKLKLSLYGKLGLSTQMINLLIDNIRVGNKDESKTLSFLQSVMSVGKHRNALEAKE